MRTGLQQCLLDRASFTGTNSLERRWILAACLSDSLGQDSVPRTMPKSRQTLCCISTESTDKGSPWFEGDLYSHRAIGTLQFGNCVSMALFHATCRVLGDGLENPVTVQTMAWPSRSRVCPVESLYLRSPRHARGYVSTLLTGTKWQNRQTWLC